MVLPLNTIVSLINNGNFQAMLGIFKNAIKIAVSPIVMMVIATVLLGLYCINQSQIGWCTAVQIICAMTYLMKQSLRTEKVFD